ncbi:MAG TPA: DUF2306 domain-containing protein [Burkholderiaceae bacterium]
MKKTGQFILYLLILVVAFKSAYYYGFTPLETASPPPFVANYKAHPFGIYLHVAAAVVALLLGPLQFSTWLRQRHRQLHRVLGRIYLGFGVLAGGLSGLYMAQFAFGGPAVRLGFACLALAWLYTGFKAYSAVRQGAIEQHRAYMMRNYALTLAAVSLRVWLPLMMIAGVQFGTAYAIVAWLCWVPNLLVAEMMWVRERERIRSASALS